MGFRLFSLFFLACLLIACASGTRESTRSENYLRYSAFELVNEDVLLRWPKRKMPLKVHLGEPPDGLFENPEALMDVVRDGVTDWTDVAAPGIPSFEFVDDPGDADIPIVWEPEPDGSWYIAHCVYDIDFFTRRFGVARILLTGKRQQGVPADLSEVYLTMLHEMGHALGLGHSPEPSDVMYARGIWWSIGMTARDRETLALLYRRPVGARVVGAKSAD